MRLAVGGEAAARWRPRPRGGGPSRSCARPWSEPVCSEWHRHVRAGGRREIAVAAGGAHDAIRLQNRHGGHAPSYSGHDSSCAMRGSFDFTDPLSPMGGPPSAPARCPGRGYRGPAAHRYTSEIGVSGLATAAPAWTIVPRASGTPRKVRMPGSVSVATDWRLDRPRRQLRAARQHPRAPIRVLERRACLHPLLISARHRA